jgi:hypothetical protein
MFKRVKQGYKVTKLEFWLYKQYKRLPIYICIIFIIIFLYFWVRISINFIKQYW